jgi:hypothetical protein
MVLPFLLAACTDPAAPEPELPKPTTQFITQARAWLPGERAALIARAQRTGQFDVLGVNLSDNAGDLLPLDSVYEIVANPYWVAPLAASPFGPLFSLSGVRVPGAGWTTFGFDIHIVNTNQANDTFDWLGALWFNNADSTWKGMLLGASAATTLPATFVNTAAFDAGNAKSGAGGGEVKVTGGLTAWIADGTGAPNQFSVSSEAFLSAAATVTTGPYLGGLRRTVLMNININNVGLTRVPGGLQAPPTQTASLSGFVFGAEFNCVFPSPCTTNVPLLAEAARRGRLTAAQRAQLPWEAAGAVR